MTLLVSSCVLFFSTAHPMSPWNRDALVSLQGDLKLKVSMSTGLSDVLVKVAGGFMSPREAQVVREQQGSSEQMGRVIETLLGKDDKDFSTFLHMLRRTNNEVWAEELEKKAEELKREKGVYREEGGHSECSSVEDRVIGTPLPVYRDALHYCTCKVNRLDVFLGTYIHCLCTYIVRV